MLHKETVQREIFKLLTSLMQDQELSAFNLAGGTALALLMGHRMSIDLDLFTPTLFDPQELERHLIEKYNFQSSYLRGYTLKGTIQNIKIDCIMHDYPLVKDIISIDNIRLYSIEDIAAMKLSAIADNGTRLKDFIDIACLSTQCSLGDMLLFPTYVIYNLLSFCLLGFVSNAARNRSRGILSLPSISSRVIWESVSSLSNF